MCGLFGFYIKDVKKLKEKNLLVKQLAKTASSRGGDATGIAYTMNSKIEIDKMAVSGNKVDFKVPKDINCVMGHTRASTHGTHTKNFNNHPFNGKTKGKEYFALAHNGVLWDYQEVKKKHKLKKTEIETDTYVAVQLLEKQKTINLESLKFLGENCGSGSFTFTVLTEGNDLHIVVGSNPFYMLYFKELGLYVYESTRELLWNAIINIKPLMDVIESDKNIEVIIPNCGDILSIKNGVLEINEKAFSLYDDYGYNAMSDWRFYQPSDNALNNDGDYYEILYKDMIKHGLTDDVATLLFEYYSWFDLEDCLSAKNPKISLYKLYKEIVDYYSPNGYEEGEVEDDEPISK